MNIGISTGCFFPEKTINALEQAGKLGVKYVELFFNTDSELEISYLEQLKEILIRYQMQVTSIHPYTSAIETFLFFSFYDYKLEDSIQFYEKYFRACNFLNCKYVVIHGCFYQYEYMDMQRYCHNLNLLSKMARRYDVYLSQENVYQYKCGYIENIKQFLLYADENIKFTFDIKQAIKSQQDIYEVLNLVGMRLSHVHISDFTSENHSLIPLEGTFDFGNFFDYLYQHTTAESALIEIYSKTLKQPEDLLKAIEKLSLYLKR